MDITLPGGSFINIHQQSDYVRIYGNGTVLAGTSPNDQVIMINGDGKVYAENANDIVGVWGNTGTISVGDGNDTLYMWGSGKIIENGASGHDTINLYVGNDTIVEQGQATVVAGDPNHNPKYGLFGGATINGGTLTVAQSHGMVTDTAVSGNMTLQGSSAPTKFFGGPGNTVMNGGSGSDTFAGGSGSDSMNAVGSNNLFEFFKSEAGGQHIISNFAAGDQLYVEGETLSYLQSQNDISVSGGNTFIKIDGGATTIELKGVTSLSSSSFTTTHS
jgi:Ca2+-binding RTX toxin-like protein